MLKRIAAISLLSVLLFNWVGYKLLTAFWEDRAAQSLEASLDRDDYDSSLLVTWRIPADALPYCNCSSRYQRAAGYIEIGRLRYREVKKRMFNDSVEFVCILDGAANRLRSAGIEFFSLVNDVQRSAPSKIPARNGQAAHNFFKIVCYSTHHFPDLHCFVIRSTGVSGHPQPGLPEGHPRLGLRPPRTGSSLS
ncbi:MAG TPA: hypothetical protein VN616_00045 [Puia sp.]|nr:hypothetical protein [Puia sp.]